MAEYIEREAIQKRLNRIVEVNNLRTDLAWFTPYGVNALIEEIPAADVRPVVTCGECIYFRLNSCMRWADGTFMERTDFCSRAAEREES